MTITLRPDIEKKPGVAGVLPQAVYELDDSHRLVALAITTALTPATTMACVAHAWLVDDQGDAQAVAGVPVRTQISHAADVQQIAALGTQGIADALRDLVMGEAPPAPPPIPWADELRAQVSIRNVIAIALAVGTPIDWSP